MSLLEITGYMASVLVGVSLGLIGGGGSILVVPVLVYLFSLAPGPATSYSLFIVGATSLVGAWRSYQQGMLSTRTAFLFGLTSIATVFITRHLLFPAIPETIVQLHTVVITKSLLIMVLFSLLMLPAGFSMIRSGRTEAPAPVGDMPVSYGRLFLNGVGIGLVTGLLGAGGGFLIIPSLVLLLRMRMKKAIGTSLLIIGLNSLIGFVGDLGQYAIDWELLFSVSLLAMGGILLGGLIGRRIPGEKLKKSFGWFVLSMAVYILTRELGHDI